jgi:hypothetical protein
MHEISPENLRNPARERRAGAMRQFRLGQLDSIRVRHGNRLFGRPAADFRA